LTFVYHHSVSTNKLALLSSHKQANISDTGTQLVL